LAQINEAQEQLIEEASDQLVRNIGFILDELRLDYERKSEPWIKKLVDIESIRSPRYMLHHSIIPPSDPAPVRVICTDKTGAVAAERERCAKIAEEMDYWHDKPIARRIRSGE
jgi:hypothetical protein